MWGRRESRALSGFGWVALCVAGCSSPTHDQADIVPLPAAEVFGHRFRITARLDGSQKADSLVEHYASQTDHGEVAKYVDHESYDILVSRAFRLDPEIFIISTSGTVDTLFIKRGGGAFGLALLVNEGDLDGDGRDEIGYVVDNADWSNTNTYVVLSFAGDDWKELFRFAIWDWQLPELPDADREYALIGQTGRRIHAPLDSMSTVDLVLPVRPGMARVVGNIGEATLDTMEISFPRAARP